MKAYEVLEKYGWTQGATARDARGIEVKWCSPYAVLFDAVGAIFKAYSGRNCRQPYDRLCEETRRMGYDSPLQWNDDHRRTKEEVINLMKKLDI